MDSKLMPNKRNTTGPKHEGCNSALLVSLVEALWSYLNIHTVWLYIYIISLCASVSPSRNSSGFSALSQRQICHSYGLEKPPI